MMRKYAKKSAFLVAKFEERDDVRLALQAPETMLLLQSGDPCGNKLNQAFEFGSFEAFS